MMISHHNDHKTSTSIEMVIIKLCGRTIVIGKMLLQENLTRSATCWFCQSNVVLLENVGGQRSSCYESNLCLFHKTFSSRLCCCKLTPANICQYIIRACDATVFLTPKHIKLGILYSSFSPNNESVYRGEHLCLPADCNQISWELASMFHDPSPKKRCWAFLV